MHKLLKYNYKEPESGVAKISYSQYAMYSKCPKQWELAYVKKLRTFQQSIHTIFGTAMHEVLQEYLDTMFNKTVKAANQMDLPGMLKDKMYNLYKEAVEEMGEHFSNKFELQEFYEDGIAIIDWFKRKRGGYFSTKSDELLGIEVPIYHPVNESSPVKMLGFIDLVIRHKNSNSITIIDFKTSTHGWNKYQKADKLKASQLVLYKKYFAEQYGFDVEKIDICYMILKRKLIEGAMFPQKRITEFVPASGTVTRNRLTRDVNNFVNNSFQPDGSYNTNKNYPAVGGKALKNCKYCQFNTEELCPKANRIRE